MHSFKRDFHSDFDFDDPEFHQRYYEVLGDMVAHCPVAHSTAGDGYWAVFDYEKVTRIAKDWEVFSSGRSGLIINRPDGIPPMLPLEMDPPRQRAWRAAVNPFFNPSAIKTWEPATRQLANDLADTFAASGRCEFVADFSGPFPAILISREILHFPEKDMPELRHNINLGVYGIVHEDGSREFDPAGFVGVKEYAKRLLTERSEESSRGDVIDAILGAEMEDGSPVGLDEKAGILYTLIFAGLDTTTSTLAAAMFHLANDPELYYRLLKDRSLLPQAVDEFIRVYQPVTAVARFATQDVDLDGVHIKEGDQVAIFLAGANVDPAEFGDPEFDIDRDNNRHLSFGFGVHRCLGSHLARMTLRVALDVLLDRLPNFKVDPDGLIESATNQRRQILSLPLLFDATPSEATS